MNPCVICGRPFAEERRCDCMHGKRLCDRCWHDHVVAYNTMLGLKRLVEPVVADA